jgi:hypothetical protein
MGMFVDKLQGVGQCSMVTERLSVDSGLEVVYPFVLQMDDSTIANLCTWTVQ